MKYKKLYEDLLKRMETFKKSDKVIIVNPLADIQVHSSAKNIVFVGEGSYRDLKFKTVSPKRYMNKQYV